MSDETLRNFGVVIAICGALFIFGGTTFAMWTFGIESEYGDTKAELTYTFAANEVETEIKSDEVSDSDDLEYEDDDECNCDGLKDFFANLKLMFYALIGCGVAIAYMANSGEIESLPTVAGITAILSVAIMAYTFVALPEAFEEDSELFESVDEDPAFIVNAERDVDGVDVHLTAMPHVGFLLPVISFTLGLLLVKPEWMD